MTAHPLDRLGNICGRRNCTYPSESWSQISPTSIRPHWSRDGKWIYFQILRSWEDRESIVARRPAEMPSHCPKISTESVPQESSNGDAVYFASHFTEVVLKKVTLRGPPGIESEVDGLPRISESNLWTLTRAGIYFVPADSPKSVRYFDFATRQIRPIFEVDKDFGTGLSVSPDGRWMHLFTSCRCEKRHHARRTLSLILPWRDVDSKIMLVPSNRRPAKGGIGKFLSGELVGEESPIDSATTSLLHMVP